MQGFFSHHCTINSKKGKKSLLQNWLPGPSFVMFEKIHIYASGTSLYTVDRNSLKTDTFHEPHVQTRFLQTINLAWNEYGRVGIFRIKKISIIQELELLEKCQFPNCSDLIASHCIYGLTSTCSLRSLSSGFKSLNKILVCVEPNKKCPFSNHHSQQPI